MNRHRWLALPLLTAALMLVAPSFASAYSKPPRGGWSVDSLFDATKGGVMKISKKDRVTKLVAILGEDKVDNCGKRITLLSKPKLRSYRKFNGRWAVARAKKRLLAPLGVRLKAKGKKRRGTLELIFDDDGRLADAQLAFGKDCFVNFLVRKKKR